MTHYCLVHPYRKAVWGKRWCQDCRYLLGYPAARLSKARHRLAPQITLAITIRGTISEESWKRAVMDTPEGEVIRDGAISARTVCAVVRFHRPSGSGTRATAIPKNAQAISRTTPATESAAAGAEGNAVAASRRS